MRSIGYNSFNFFYSLASLLAKVELAIVIAPKIDQNRILWFRTNLESFYSKKEFFEYVILPSIHPKVQRQNLERIQCHILPDQIHYSACGTIANVLSLPLSDVSWRGYAVNLRIPIHHHNPREGKHPFL